MRMLTCQEVARLVAQDELGASRWQRIEVRLHLLMCRFCRRYRAQLRAIGDVSRQVFGAATEDASTLARLERSILERHGLEP